MASQLDRYKRFHTGGGAGRPFMRDNRWNRRGREGAWRDVIWRVCLGVSVRGWLRGRAWRVRGCFSLSLSLSPCLCIPFCLYLCGPAAAARVRGVAGPGEVLLGLVFSLSLCLSLLILFLYLCVTHSGCGFDCLFLSAPASALFGRAWRRCTACTTVQFNPPPPTLTPKLHAQTRRTATPSPTRWTPCWPPPKSGRTATRSPRFPRRGSPSSSWWAAFTRARPRLTRRRPRRGCRRRPRRGGEVRGPSRIEWVWYLWVCVLCKSG